MIAQDAPSTHGSSEQPPAPAGKSALRFVLVAGEASGDQIGGPLITALKARYPNAQFAGIGGPAMRQAGLECWWDCNELAVMGLVEVLKHLPRLLGLRRALLRRCEQFAPTCYIGIDAPDFNLGVEKRVRQHGIKTIHYVSPSIWAWRRKRAMKIGRSADLVLCLFPFEPDLYAKYAVAAEFVGHPVADEIGLQPDQVEARTQLQLPDTRIVAVLPGSRVSEVQRLGPVFAEAMAILKQRRPALEFVSPAANTTTMGIFAEQLKHHNVSAHLHQGDSRSAMIASDLVLLASGTAALEAMLSKRPMVVGYKVAPLTYRLVSLLGMLKVDYFSLPNALTSEPLVPEFMQDDFIASRLADEVLELLDNPPRVSAMTEEFEQVHQSLRGDGAGRAAAAVARLLESIA